MNAEEKVARHRAQRAGGGRRRAGAAESVGWWERLLQPLPAAPSALHPISGVYPTPAAQATLQEATLLVHL